jgi:hypothetical protein
MSLFSNEVLGSQTAVASAAYGTGALVQNSEVVVWPLTASTASGAIFIADNAYKVQNVKVIFGTASTSGTVNVETRASGVAAGSGTAVLNTALSLAGTANTVTSANPKNVDTATLAAGQVLGIVMGGTLTNLANAIVVITLTRLS